MFLGGEIFIPHRNTVYSVSLNNAFALAIKKNFPSGRVIGIVAHSVTLPARECKLNIRVTGIVIGKNYVLYHRPLAIAVKRVK